MYPIDAIEEHFGSIGVVGDKDKAEDHVVVVAEGTVVQQPF